MHMNNECVVCMLVSHSKFVYTMGTLKYAENVSEDKTLIHKLRKS